MRHVVSTIILFGIGLLAKPVSGIGQKTQKPNVIVILADDMGIGDISLFNDGLSRTPSLDRLIQEGVYFNNAYSGAPVCSPSRAALITGRYPHRTGSVTLNMQQYPELSRIAKNETTIADIFQKNGYATGLIGKWHSGLGDNYHPLNRGFDQFEGFAGAFHVPDSYYNYSLESQGEYHRVNDNYLTTDLTERAVNFVRKQRNSPFFLFLAHYAPHRPLSAPEELIGEYRKKGLDKNTATVYAMIEVMDSGIGKLMDELKSLGIDDETIIIFSSDNGPDPLAGNRFNMNMKGTKYTVNEGGIHVPFLVRWPGHITPGNREQIIHFTDILPSLTDMLSLNVPSDLKLDGGSFKPVLFDENAKSDLPEQRFWQWNRGVPMYSHNAAMREGKWKLVLPYVTRGIPDAESVEKPILYNTLKDPNETIDVSEKNSQQFDRMRVYLRQWSREVETDRLKIND